MNLRCIECNKSPEELCEYVNAAAETEITLEQYVIEEEGTLDRLSGLFWCTRCYIKLDMPLGKARKLER